MADGGSVDLSVVTAAHNEQENLGPLLDQIHEALKPLDLDFEIVVVDDGSTDGTQKVLRKSRKRHPQLRVLKMINKAGGGLGQSAAFGAGIRVARGELVALIDADLQNDPADIPVLLGRLRSSGADVVQGDRRAARRADGTLRQASSLVGRIFRRLLLGDTIADTGCSLRILPREAALKLPLEYRGMHRFIPFTCRQLGYRVVEQPVRHRARVAGQTNYGTLSRAIAGLVDCFAVRWMRNRRRSVEYEELSDHAGVR
jgi:dolichol-phosphate mannosyltransferase